jgi:hypothetical protein
MNQREKYGDEPAELMKGFVVTLDYGKSSSLMGKLTINGHFQ